jgi:hypothetical protein
MKRILTMLILGGDGLQCIATHIVDWSGFGNRPDKAAPWTGRRRHHIAPPASAAIVKIVTLGAKKVLSWRGMKPPSVQLIIISIELRVGTLRALPMLQFIAPHAWCVRLF